MKKSEKIYYLALGMALMLALNTVWPAVTPVLAASLQKTITVTYNDIKLYVDGKLTTPRDGNGAVVEPFISDGTTYLPVRAVADALGKTVEWDGATQSVYIGGKAVAVQYITDVLKPVEISNDDNVKIYSSLKSGGKDKFTIEGHVFANGITFYDAPHYIVYYVNDKYLSFTGTLGHIDGNSYTTGKGAAVLIYCDDELRGRYPVSNNMVSKVITINLTGVKRLKIETTYGDVANSDEFGLFGIGDPVLR